MDEPIYSSERKDFDYTKCVVHSGEEWCLKPYGHLGAHEFSKRSNTEQKARPMNLITMADGVRMLLEGMGVNLEDENFKETPLRVAKLYHEMLTPQENNWATFPSKTKGMVVLRGHKVFAVCPHHLMPVELRAYVAYIPKDEVLGLSKLARVVEQQLTIPMMQETLGDLVANAIEETIKPQGCAVVLAGVHGCMRFRGVQTEGDVVTSSMRGLFLHSIQTREEFMQIIGRP